MSIFNPHFYCLHILQLIMAVKILVMGVSGSGKTSIGKALSQHYGVPLLEGDDFHPQSNIEKMSSGIPLNDVDRQPWLQSLAAVMEKLNDRGYIVASSALKEQYRQVLTAEGKNNFVTVFLKGKQEVIQRRMELRSDHFMPPTLLESQFEALELPTDAIEVDINLSIDEQVTYVVQEIDKKNKTENRIMSQNIRKANIGIIGLGVQRL